MIPKMHLDRIEFDVRGATGGTGRNGQFRTSLDTDDPFLWGPDNGPYLWENNNLDGRTTGNWQRIVVDLSGSKYQNLTEQTVSFIWGTTNAIDLDTIEVYGTVGDGAAPIRLTITPHEVNLGNYDFEWNSQSGKVYDLVSSTDLTTPIAGWPVWEGQADLPGTGFTNVLENVPGGGDSRRFFAVIENDTPPLYSEDFEADDGGFSIIGTPNDWAWGTPNSDNDAGFVITTGHGGSAKCWSTNPGAGGTPSGTISPAVESILRSRDFDLAHVSGAKLSFAAAYDMKDGDVIEVRVRDASNDALLDTITPVAAALPASSDWTTLGPFDLSFADNTNIYLEFRFVGTDSAFIGFYIDDVILTR